MRCAENLRFTGKVNNVTVKRIADRWFAVVNIETVETLNETPVACENQAVVGVDLGLKSLAVTSDGQVFNNPHALKSRLKSLKRQHRSLQRKVKGSNNRFKQQMKVARAHYKVSCVRKNALHEATTAIVNSASAIVLEDLNVSGMTKNHNLALAINDIGMYEFRRQITYKAQWQGKQVIIADRWFASSKTCSCCDWIKQDLKLSDRVFCCESCGLIIDRDLNAAINLKNYGTAKLAESAQEKRKACGEGSSATSEIISTALFSLSVKQEINVLCNKYNANCTHY